jgi:hypothetical protein
MAGFEVTRVRNGSVWDTCYTNALRQYRVFNNPGDIPPTIDVDFPPDRVVALCKWANDITELLKRRGDSNSFQLCPPPWSFTPDYFHPEVEFVGTVRVVKSDEHFRVIAGSMTNFIRDEEIIVWLPIPSSFEIILSYIEIGCCLNINPAILEIAKATLAGTVKHAKDVEMLMPLRRDNHALVTNMVKVIQRTPVFSGICLPEI